MDIESPVTETLARDMCRHLETFAASISVSPQIVFCLDHALAEHVQNLFDHSDATLSKLRLQSLQGKLIITVWDNGTPYNILNHPPVDISIPFLERPIGGLGIHMIRKLLDEVYYTSADSWNTAIFIKKINTTALEVS
jgi:anti-sigma regulatory factor (Ser/Thr protein kinase)